MHWTTSCGVEHLLGLRFKMFERGVTEGIYLRALNPSLNRDGGRYNLSPVWDIINKRLKADRPRKWWGATISKHNVPSDFGRKRDLWSWQGSVKAFLLVMFHPVIFNFSVLCKPQLLFSTISHFVFLWAPLLILFLDVACQQKTVRIAS